MKQENFKEVANKIRQFPIVEYANIIGLTPVKKGIYYSLKEHDSVIIKPQQNWFIRNSTGAHGSIIDFSMEFEGKSQTDAIKDLDKLINGGSFEPVLKDLSPAPKKAVSKQFELPAKDNNFKNAFAYLVNTRKIDKDIVSDFIKNKNLYQDEHKNCVFVSYDKNGQADFACKRGTNTSKRFIADVAGNNYNRCFYIDNNAQSLIVSESVIDAMSVMTMIKQNGADYKDYNYCALSGTEKYPAVLNHIKDNPNINQVILAVDNDNAGFLCCENIRNSLKDVDFKGKIIENLPKNTKDWNAELSFLKGQKNTKPLANKRSLAPSIEMEK